ncbi:contactin-associated protein-like 5 [Dunckerocampus dactyliophorus]|uniref:contactin-associated protein-like 5 n=1 Tax=Dunckerocampus dactyliophorus TaxID=161453 RepID=UPI0024070FF0|nr:contactin-associated protein-like 5 [Dunckerocampus dactyliophorus]
MRMMKMLALLGVVWIHLIASAASHYSCNAPLVSTLPRSSFSSSSQSSSGNASHFAKMDTRDGDASWSPAEMDPTPWLQLDLREPMETNADAQASVLVKLSPPPRCRFLRFVPLEWTSRDGPGMHVDVFGCSYKSHMADFDGQSALLYRFKQKSVSTAKDIISLRFKSRRADGVLLHGEGRRGHFITLELRAARLVLHLNLDNTSEGQGGGEVAVTVGSLLDDERWHWVAIERLNKQVKVSVDRHTQSFETRGQGESLEVDYELSFGGIPLPGKPGTFLRSNFEGCMENVYYNGINVIDLAKRRKPQMYTVGNVTFSCLRPDRTACTFVSSKNSFLWLPAALQTTIDGGGFSIRFQFRTWNPNALLLATGLGLRHWKLRLHISNGQLLLSNAATGPRVNDGLWHWLSMDYNGLRVVLTLDHQPIVTVRQPYPLEPNEGFFFGGCGASGCQRRSLSFQGCIRQLSIDRRPVNLSLVRRGLLGSFSSLNFDACHIRDRCLPNMCEHGTSCTQTWNHFNCDCSGSGYAGATCRHSIFESSCESYKLRGGSSGFYSIDPDGSGPLGPTRVYCNMTDDKVWTLMSHNVTLPVRISDSSKHKPHIMKFNYSASPQQLRAIVMASEQCQQEVVFSCKKSHLFIAEDRRPLCWWLDQRGERRSYRGSSNNVWSKDSEVLSHKEHLPLSVVIVKESEAVYRVGPLRCHGDRHLWNMVSFYQEGAYLHFSPLQATQTFDLTFYFKTAAPSGVILDSQGRKDLIRVELSSPSVVTMSFSAAVVAVKSHLPLNDGQWHYVRAERNVKEAWLQVDQIPVGFLEAPPDGAAHLDLGGQLFVGGAPSGPQSFLGCIRSLTVNGLTYDLQERAKKAFGVSPTCPGYCDASSIVCHNHGRCVEKSDGFSCDCSRSAYAGLLCKDEVALFFDKEMSVTYTFSPRHHRKSPVFHGGGGRVREDVTFSFVTLRRPAMLLSIKSFMTHYIAVLLAGDGSLRVWYGLQSDGKPEVFSPASSSLADGRPHRVRILRESNTLCVQVDQEVNRKFTLGSEAEPILITTMTLGKVTLNESLPLEVVSAGQAGFIGCLSSVHVNHVAPLKAALLQRGISPVDVPGALVWSRCSIASHNLKEQTTTTTTTASKDGSQKETGLVTGCVVALIFTAACLLTAMICLLYRCRPQS